MERTEGVTVAKQYEKRYLFVDRELYDFLHDIGRKEQFENSDVCHARDEAEKALKFLLDIVLINLLSSFFIESSQEVYRLLEKF